MSPVVFALPDNEALAQELVTAVDAERGAMEIRNFPDGETYVRLDTGVAGRPVIIAASLNVPDGKLAPLLFIGRTARDLGAASIVLVAPYLAYMRQDRAFRPGEGVTSRFFAEFVSSFADALVTVDPHLHRTAALPALYHIPSQVVHAAPWIGQWLKANVASPLVVGPDEESRQWVAAVAEAANAPYIMLEKVRHGDRDVQVSVPQVAQWRNRTPVLVDDIISTAHTMIETIRHLSVAAMPAPLCVGVHAVFSDSAYANLLKAGAARVVTCNTIAHPSNAIDVLPGVSDAVRTVLGFPQNHRLDALSPPNR